MIAAGKAFRHEQILKAVRARPVRSQAELAAALRRAGLAATQVTLSRDLKELRLIKTPRGYAPLEKAPADADGAAHGAPTAAAPAAAHVLREFVRDLRPAQHLLVVKTEPGAASSVGAALDALGWRELAGSLAGDDTVLVVCPQTRARAALQLRLRALLGTSA